MTPNQRGLYWREWAACRRALIESGRSPKEADALRHDLHRRALGDDKSSLNFTNWEFDRVLAIFWSYSMPDNLSAQMRQENQPSIRSRWVAEMLLDRIDEVAPRHYEAYLSGMAGRMCKRSLFELDEGNWITIIAALDKQAKRVEQRRKKVLAEV